MKVSAIVPAAGNSQRMKGCLKEKPYLRLGDRPILAHTLEILDKSQAIEEIVVVASKANIESIENEVIARYSIGKVKKVVLGGPTRFHSVYNGLKYIGADVDFVLVHDAVRPFITHDLITASLEAARDFGGAVVAVPEESTTKDVGEDLFINSTLNRERLWRVQTPQAFRRDLLARGYESAINAGIIPTDDSALVERLGHKVKVLMGSYYNIKITTPEDLLIAEAILARGSQCE